MKIAGQEAAPEKLSKTIILPKKKPLELTIQSLPLCFEEQVDAWIPTPRPAKKYVTKKGSATVLRDPSTGQYVTEDDITDAHIALLKKTIMLKGVAMVHEGLRLAAKLGQIEWTTPEVTDDDKKAAFYESIFNEMKAANFTTGDLRLLMAEINEISSKKTEALEESRESFSSEGS